MSEVWIVHRDPRLALALARLADLGDRAVVGAPSDHDFGEQAQPAVVMLALAGDMELELEFAHRQLRRLPGTRWLLLAEPGDEAEAARLFDLLPARVLPFPPPGEALRAALRDARSERHAERLSDRRRRDRLARRFSQYFGDLELPGLLRALDPRMAGVPVVLRGEPGTGRGLLARYLHAFGGSSGGGFVSFACSREVRPDQILAAVAGAMTGPADAAALTVHLDAADALPPSTQHSVRHWVELGMPAGAAALARVRWIASIGPSGSRGELDPGLSQALAGVRLQIPALRERPEVVLPFAEATIRGWCEALGERERRLSPEAVEALRHHPWPGNLRELEAVLVRSLAESSADPLRGSDLRFGEAPPASGSLGADRELEAPSPPGEPLDAPLPAGGAAGGEAEAPGTIPDRRPAGERPEPGAGPHPSPEDGSLLRRLAAAVDHAVRNPLVSIRTFAGLLPERFDDPEFRDRFREVVGHDLARIERVLDRLARLGNAGEVAEGPVDLAAAVDALLAGKRPEIEARRLVVLRELGGAVTLGDPERVAFVCEAVVGRALAWAPPGADCYIATRSRSGGASSGPRVQLLARVRGSESSAPEAAGEVDLEVVLADWVVRSLGGHLALSARDPRELVISVELPGTS